MLMATEGVRRLRSLMEEKYAPYIRGKNYRDAFDRMLQILSREEFDDSKLGDQEVIYLFFQLVLLDGFDRIERLEKQLGMPTRRMF